MTRKGESCVTTLEYLGALDDAAALEKGLGDPAFASPVQGARGACAERALQPMLERRAGLLADTPEQNELQPAGQHSGRALRRGSQGTQQAVLRQMMAMEPGTTPDGMLSASYYFRFYLARALDHAGMADEYLNSIEPWRKLLALHFSTWPEVPGETRSDSHAWTAHPIYDLLTLVAGIEPASPGFATVRIAPHMGALPSLTATFPHPEGEIKVEYARRAQG